MSEPPKEEPSRATFDRWAREEPKRLLRVLTEGTLSAALLTFAAETAGQALASDVVVPPLLALLDRPEPLVREGAVLGLTRHLARDGVTERLRTIAASDQSPGVRSRAVDAMESLDP